MDWLFLALLTPVLWSIVVLIDDNLIRGIYKSPYTGAIISGGFGLAPLLSLLWMEMEPTTLLIGAIGIMSGFLTVFYYFYYFHALEKESPSVVIALFSLTPATIPFMAYVLLGEQLTYHQIIGFVIVLVFTFLLAAVDVRKFKFSKALAPILAAVLLMDIVLISGKYVYDRIDFYSGFMFFSMGMGTAALLLLFVEMYSKQYAGKKFRFPPKRHVVMILILVVLTEIINVGAEFTSNLAISRGPVSLVEVIQNTQPMYMLLIALALYPFYPKYFREAGQGKIRFKLLMMTGIIAGVAVTIAGSV